MKRIPPLLIAGLISLSATAHANTILATHTIDFSGANGTFPEGWYDGELSRYGFTREVTELDSGWLRMERANTYESNTGGVRFVLYRGGDSAYWEDYQVRTVLKENRQDATTHVTGLVARWQGASDQNGGYLAYEQDGRLYLGAGLSPADGAGEVLAEADLSRAIANNEEVSLVFTLDGPELHAELFAADTNGDFTVSLGEVEVTDHRYTRGSSGLLASFSYHSRSALFDYLEVDVYAVGSPMVVFDTSFDGPDEEYPDDWYDPALLASNFFTPIIEIDSGLLRLERKNTPESNSGARRHAIYQGDTTQYWMDYTVETLWSENRQDASNHATGLVARWQGAGDQQGGYFAYEEGGVLKIGHGLSLSSNIDTELASESLSRSIANNEVTRLVFTVEGDYLEAAIFAEGSPGVYDDLLARVSVRDDTYTRGSAGVRAYFSYHSRHASFYDFEVRVSKMGVELIEQLSELWVGQWDCVDCEYIIPENSTETNAQKRYLLRELRRVLAEDHVGGPTPFSSFTDHASYLLNLRSDGRFEDLISLETSDPGLARVTAIQRLTVLSEQFHWTLGEERSEDYALREKLFKGIAYYAKSEADNPGEVEAWHTPCFLMPSCAANMFFFFLPEMEAVESGASDDPLFWEVYIQLHRVALQSFTMRPRSDHTDGHPICPERFRNDAEWVGANATGYRPIFQVAALFMVPEMMDTVEIVTAGAMAPTSQHLIDTNEAFWSEGMTADGLGWGHGRQNYTEFYPWHGVFGTSNVLGSLRILDKLDEYGYTDIDAISPTGALEFLRGATWLHYKGWDAPMGRGRYTFQAASGPRVRYASGSYAGITRVAFEDVLDAGEISELQDLAIEGGILMDGYPDGYYVGTRYFWNNDALAKKTDDFYFFVAMASSRVDGVESYGTGDNDRLNLFSRDGHYVILRDGDEINRHKGTWEPTALPGVTARYTPIGDLTIVNNYRGFTSLHNFAGGVARSGNGAAGFIFEKDDDTLHPHDPEIYGVIAYKSYFIFDDTIVALGAGIEDDTPGLGGDVWTTINHTAWRTNLVHARGTGSSQSVAVGGDVDESYTLLNAQDPVWVDQDDILYVVLPAQSDGVAEIEAYDTLTHWDELTGRTITAETLDVFTMRINHGADPSAARYGYLMYTGNASPTTYLGQLPVEVLSNTTSLQAVGSSDGENVQAVFYSSSPTLHVDEGDWDMSVSAPAVVMAELGNDQLVLTVSDPQQNPSLTSLDISLTFPVYGSGVSEVGGEWVVTIPMPDGADLGRPVSVTLDTVPLELATAQTGYETWMTHYDLDETESRIAASPAGDGWSNLQKYAMGLRPDRRAHGAELPSSGVYIDDEGRRWLEWVQRERTDDPDLTGALEISPDMKTWVNVEAGGWNLQIEVIDTDVLDGASIEWVRYRVRVSGPLYFLRYRWILENGGTRWTEQVQ